MLATRTLSDENRAALDGDHPLDTIAIPTGAVDAVELTNFTTVGSYSYLEGDDPILLIPSAPPIVKVQLPVSLQQDSGPRVTECNAYKSPLCPLEPAIQTAALLASSASVFADLDLIIDRRLLGSLFNMVRGKTVPLRIDGELLGTKTVTLMRSGGKLVDHYEGKRESRRGYLAEFANSQTVKAEGCEEAAFDGACWRVAKYNLGPLTLLVSYKANSQLINHQRSAPSSAAASSLCVPDLAGLLSAAQLSSSPSATHSFQSPSPLSYRLTSTSIPAQSSLVKIKARARNRPADPTVYWEQMFFTQTPHLWIGTHDKTGRFSPRGLEEYGLSFRSMREFAEREGMDAVARVVEVLKEMKEVVVREGKKGDGVSFVFEPGREGLEVWKTKEEFRRRLVGKEVRAKFD